MRYLRTWHDSPSNTEEIGRERWHEIAFGWTGGKEAAEELGFDSENAHYWTMEDLRDDIASGEVWPEADDAPLTILEVELLESLERRIVDCRRGWR